MEFMNVKDLTFENNETHNLIHLNNGRNFNA